MLGVVCLKKKYIILSIDKCNSSSISFVLTHFFCFHIILLGGRRVLVLTWYNLYQEFCLCLVPLFVFWEIIFCNSIIMELSYGIFSKYYCFCYLHSDQQSTWSLFLWILWWSRVMIIPISFCWHCYLRRLLPIRSSTFFWTFCSIPLILLPMLLSKQWTLFITVLITCKLRLPTLSYFQCYFIKLYLTLSFHV